MKEKDNIEQFLNQKLSNYTGMRPSDKAYKKIAGKLMWFRFLDKLKIFGSALVLISVIFLIYFNISDSDNNTSVKISITTTNIASQKTLSKNDSPIANKTINISTNIVSGTNISKDNNFTVNYKKNTNLHPTNNITNNLKTSENAVSYNKNNNENIIINNQEFTNKTDKYNSSLTQVNNTKESQIIQEATIESDISKTFTISDENNKIIKNYKKKESFNKKIINKLSLEASINLYTIHKNISGNQNYSENIKARTNSESTINILSPELELRFDCKHFFLQTGLNLMTYGEKTNYSLTKSFQTINSINYWKDTLIFTGGNWKYDSVFATTYDTINGLQTQKQQYSNYYKYLEIPILIGHTFMLKRFSFDISTGISTGILIEANAQILNSDNNSIIEIKDKNSPMTNQIMLNYLFRFACRYNVTNNLSMFIRSSSKINALNIFDSNNYQVNQKYNAFGIGLGVTYKF